MPLKQFINTIDLILESRQPKKFKSILRHLFWQVRKLLNLFPYRQIISKSIIVADNKYNGVSALINCLGMYDYNNMNLIKILLEEGGTFFDIGANIGPYSLVASEQHRAKIYSFEAHPKTFSNLLTNININNRNNVKAFNVAVSEKDGTVFFSDFLQNPINRILNEDEDHSISVESIRIDTFIDEYKIIPDYVKIDVEGFEYNVLLSIGKYLESIKLLFIETNPRGEYTLLNDLLKNNFIGPLSFHFNDLVFEKKTNYNREDSIYIHKDFIEVLTKMNHDFKMK